MNFEITFESKKSDVVSRSIVQIRKERTPGLGIHSFLSYLVVQKEPFKIGLINYCIVTCPSVSVNATNPCSIPIKTTDSH